MGPHREVPPTVVAEGRRLSASGPAESSTPTRHEPQPPPRPRPGGPTSRSPWRGPGRLRAEPRQPVRLQVESLSTVQEPSLPSRRTAISMQPEKQEDARARGTTASWRETADGPHGTREYTRIVTDLTESQHLNSHIHQGVEGAAAGTLRQCLSNGLSGRNGPRNAGFTPATRRWRTWPITCTKWSPEPGKTAPA